MGGKRMEFNNTAPRSTFGEAYTPDIHCLVLDGDRLCTGGKDMNIKIRKFETGEEERTLEGHSYDVNAIAVAGSTLFSGADAKGPDRQFLMAWDMETGVSHSFASPHDGGVWSLAVDEASGRLFSGSDDRTIHVNDINTHECTRVLEGHEAKVRCLQFCASDQRLYSGGHDGKVLAWDVEAGEISSRYEGQNNSFVTALVVDEDAVFAASSDKTVCIWDKVTGEKRHVLNHDTWVSALVRHGSTLFVGLGDGTVKAWDVEKEVVLYTLKAHTKFNAVSAMLMHGDDLVTAGWDGMVCVWDVLTLGEQAASHAANIKEVASVPQKGVEMINDVQENSMFDSTDCELLD